MSSKIPSVSRDVSSPRIDSTSSNQLSRGNSSTRMTDGKIVPLSRGNSSAIHVASFRLDRSVSRLSSRRLIASDSDSSIRSTSPAPSRSISPTSAASIPPPTHSLAYEFVHDNRVTGSDFDPVQILYEGELTLVNDNTFWVIAHHTKYDCYELVFVGKMFLPNSAKTSAIKSELICCPLVDYRRIYLKGPHVEALAERDNISKVVQEKQDFFRKRHRHFEVETLQKLARTQIIKEALERDINYIISQSEYMVLNNLDVDSEQADTTLFKNLLRSKPDCLVPVNVSLDNRNHAHEEYLHAENIHSIFLKSVQNFQKVCCQQYRPIVLAQHVRNLPFSRFLARSLKSDCFLISTARYRWMRAIDAVIQRNVYLAVLRRLMKQAINRMTLLDNKCPKNNNESKSHDCQQLHEVEEDIEETARKLSLQIKAILGEDLNDNVGDEALLTSNTFVVKRQVFASELSPGQSSKDISKFFDLNLKSIDDKYTDKHHQFLLRLKQKQLLQEQQRNFENILVSPHHDIDNTKSIRSTRIVRSSAELRSAAFEANMRSYR